MFFANLILIVLPVTHALVFPKPHEPDDKLSNIPMSFPKQTWYHPSDHPVHALFKRDDATDNTTYAPVGSPGKSV